MPNTPNHLNSKLHNAETSLQPEAGLSESFAEEVKQIYFIEKNLKKVFLLLQKSAVNADLIDVILEHAELSNSHLSKLEEVFQLLGVKAQQKKSDLIDRFAKEAGSLIEDTEEASMRDEGITRIFMKITDFQIEAYGDLTEAAEKLALSKVSAVFNTIIQEKTQSQDNIAGITDNESNYLPED